MATVEINESIFRDIEADLKRAEAIDRSPALRKGMSAAVKVVSKRTRQKLPRPGSPGYTGGRTTTPLYRAVGTKVYEDHKSGDRLTARVTWNRKRGGYHGHLVELGHKMKNGGRVKGQFHLEHSFNETRSEQKSAIDEGVKKALKGKS